jgi:hypothetical protein
MFVGHYAPAFAAAAIDRRSPTLGKLFVAAQLVDFAFFGLSLAGIERFRVQPGTTVISPFDLYHMPYTHSLIGTLGFAAAWAIGARLLGASWRAAYLGAAVVASHWLLDWLVHAPDLTVLGYGPRHGLGLWNYPFVEMPLELALVALAATFYASRTVNLSGGWGASASLGALLAALAFVQLVEWLGPRPLAPIDPPPLSIPLSALSVYVALACLAAWVAQTRAPR